MATVRTIFATLAVFTAFTGLVAFAESPAEIPEWPAQSVWFQSGVTSLDARGKETISALADHVARIADYEGVEIAVFVVGVAWDEGKHPGEKSLSRDRAISAARELEARLAENKIFSSDWTIVGAGDLCPLIPSTAPEHAPLNRVVWMEVEIRGANSRGYSGNNYWRSCIVHAQPQWWRQ